MKNKISKLKGEKFRILFNLIIKILYFSMYISKNNPIKQLFGNFYYFLWCYLDSPTFQVVGIIPVKFKRIGWFLYNFLYIAIEIIKFGGKNQKNNYNIVSWMILLLKPMNLILLFFVFKNFFVFFCLVFKINDKLQWYFSRAEA